MNIGVDLMGGDYAPDVVIEATKNLAKQQNFSITLFGLANAIEKAKSQINSNQVHYVVCDSVIEMNEHPTRAYKLKPNSSLSLGFQYLAANKIDAFASAGNSGAMMVGAHFFLKTVNGVIRPTIGVFVPQLNGKKSLLLDVGLNTDTKPEQLVQFAELGHLFAQNVLQIQKPRIALLNIGEEPEKGNIVAQQTNELLQKQTKINFIGNLESRYLFNDKADVFVCDGFTGNIVLKLCETIFDIGKERNIKDDYINRFNFEVEGGVPVLGINKSVIVGHGVSSSYAIENMILQAFTIGKTDFIKDTEQWFSAQ